MRLPVSKYTYAIYFFVFLALEMILYWNFTKSVFAMDDPSLINFFQNPNASTSDKLFPSLVANRFRPVADVFQFFTFQALANSYFGWVVLNLIVLAATATVLAQLILKLHKSWLLAALGGMLLISSRFVLYQATQANGLMEGVALLLFMGLVYLAVDDWKITRRLTVYLAPALYFLLVMTHERFQGLVVALIAWALLNTQLSKRQKVGMVAGTILPVVTLNVVKIFLAIPLAVGTGSATELGLDWGAVPIFLTTVFLNALGINFGPNYLFGLTIEFQDFGQAFASYLIAAFTIAAIVRAITHVRKTEEHAGRTLLIVVLFLAGLVAPIISTIRVEPRWITSIFIVCILLIIQFIAGKPNLTKKKFSKTGIVIMCLSSVYLNLSFLTNSDNIYFRNHQITAEKYISQWVPILERSAKEDKPIVIVSGCAGDSPAGWFNALLKANIQNQVIEPITCTDVVPDPFKTLQVSWDESSGDLLKLN